MNAICKQTAATLANQNAGQKMADFIRSRAITQNFEPADAGTLSLYGSGFKEWASVVAHSCAC